MKASTRLSAALGAVTLVLVSLSACGGSSGPQGVTVPAIAPSAGLHLNYAQTTSLLMTLLPAAVQQEGMSKATFCSGVLRMDDATITASFMGGFSASAGESSVDPTAVAPAIRSFCATSV